MLSGKNIQKRYGTVEVLKGVDISIGQGEIVSIVGPSGSGKSTLLHILGTLDQPDTGHIEASGRRIEYQPRITLDPAAWWQRLLNFLIDRTLITAIVASIASFLGWPVVDFSDQPALINEALLWIGVAAVYLILFEYLSGGTPGKWITGTKVVITNEGTKPGFVNVLLRTVSRCIPFNEFSFFSARPVSWYDSASNTMVVSSRIPYQQRIANRLSANELSLFRNKHMGFVFQFHHLLPEFTALENVCIPGWLAGGKKADVKKRAHELLAMLNLSHRTDNKPNQLSGGEQQRVAVARALINKPDIIFADEPTGNLDSANAEELHRLFFDLREKFNQTFLVVTHNEELARISDRVLHMKDGKIV